MSEIEHIEEILKGTELPSWVGELRVEPIEDWTGAKAVNVWVIGRRRRDARLPTGASMAALRRRIHEALRREGVTLWAYLRYLSAEDAA